MGSIQHQNEDLEALSILRTHFVDVVNHVMGSIWDQNGRSCRYSGPTLQTRESYYGLYIVRDLLPSFPPLCRTTGSSTSNILCFFFFSFVRPQLVQYKHSLYLFMRMSEVRGGEGSSFHLEMQDQATDSFLRFTSFMSNLP